MAVNHPAVAVGQAYTVNEDDTLVVPAATGLLRGATDEDNDPMFVVSNGAPSKGTLTVQRDGSFVYAPSPDFNGQDSFQFAVADTKLDGSRAMATITVGELRMKSRAGEGGLGGFVWGTERVCWACGSTDYSGQGAFSAGTVTL